MRQSRTPLISAMQAIRKFQLFWARMVWRGEGNDVHAMVRGDTRANNLINKNKVSWETSRSFALNQMGTSEKWEGGEDGS